MSHSPAGENFTLSNPPHPLSGKRGKFECFLLNEKEFDSAFFRLLVVIV